MPKFNSEKLKKLHKIDSLFKRFYLKPKNKREYPSIENIEVREVLIIAFFLIGDTVMSIPALNVIRKNFPLAKISIIGGVTVRTILENQGLIDNFIIANAPWVSPFDSSIKNVWHFLSSLNVVNKKNYDLVIDFRGDWRNIFFMNFIKAKRKVSFDYTGGAYMLTDVIKSDENNNHYVYEWLNLLKKIGLRVDDTQIFPVINLTKKEKDFLQSQRIKYNLNNTLVLGVHPGASQTDRKWNEKNYAELLIRLIKEFKNCKIIIFEGPNEADSIDKIKSILDSNSLSFQLINEGFKAYMISLNLCDLIICNDSGAGHLAGAFGIPTVSVFGKSDPVLVKPFNKAKHAIISHLKFDFVDDKEGAEKTHQYYLQDISVEEVFDATSEIINDVYKPIKSNS